MRQVVFLALPELVPLVLEICSRLTPLVEPESDGVFLDLNGCGQPEEVLFQLSSELAALPSETEEKKRLELGLGMAGSRMAAFVAAKWTVSREKLVLCRFRSLKNVSIVMVDKGRDADFLGQFLIEDFPLLKSSEARRLRRAGFRRVEELQDMSGAQLGRLLGRRDVWELEQGLKASDGTLVMGLYPPERLLYRRVFEPEIRSRQELEAQLEYAAGLLGKCLEKRHSSAGLLLIRLYTGEGLLEAERILQVACAGSGRMRTLLNGMLGHLLAANPASKAAGSSLSAYIGGLELCLERLEEIKLEQPLLFSASGHCRESWQGSRIDESLNKLLDRFPRAISKGLQMDWREQVLSLWDPWRYSPEKQ